MNKYKILIGINTILLFSLIVCIFFLTKKTSRKDAVKELAIELLDGMIKETQDDFSEHFKYFEARNFIIRERIDTFYILMNQENVFCSSQFMNYYDEIGSRDSQETEKFFNTLCSIKNKESQDFILMSKLMEYRFIKKTIERSGYLSFFWFDGLGVNVSSNKDTIRLGEEYMAKITYSGDILNKEQQPIVVIDRDTLNADYGYCKFKEKPRKRGLVKHKGYITYFHPLVGIGKSSLEFEYYVK
ncbi:hypothetical protein M0Q39_07000 [Patescibacteria group bacterium]|nr:hypothetical protein [Patescibacteria group bacterium]